ncbi:MAG: hypothetical protein EZS28_043348, partial [Streblomastix strix]
MKAQQQMDGKVIDGSVLEVKIQQNQSSAQIPQLSEISSIIIRNLNPGNGITAEIAQNSNLKYSQPPKIVFDDHHQSSPNEQDINRKGLFIKNIASTVTKRMIELVFTPFNLKGCNIQTNSQKPGIAFLLFNYEEDAQEALDMMNNKIIEGLNIEIEFQKRNERSPPISPPRMRPPQQLPLQPRIGDNKKGLYITNISPQITSAEFELIFIAFSPTKFVIPNGQPNTRPHFGFVDFETEEDASQAVVHINGIKVDGLALRLEYNNKPTPDRSKQTGGISLNQNNFSPFVDPVTNNNQQQNLRRIIEEEEERRREEDQRRKA